MDRIDVVSKNLKSVGYESDIQTLEIEFHYPGVYQYYGVPANVFNGLLSASSKDGYYRDHIENKYRYRQLR